VVRPVERSENLHCNLDLYTSNVAFEIRDLDGEPEKNAFMALSSPECVPTITEDPQDQTDTFPKYRVFPRSLLDLVKLDDLRIKIIDFGEGSSSGIQSFP
jgi:hypothetical protein